MSNLVNVLFNFDQNTLFFQISYDVLTALETVLTLVRACIRIHRTAFVHNKNLRQVVTLTYFEIVRIMSRCDFNRAAAELFFYIVVCNNRNFTINDWEQQGLSDQVLITLIFRMNSNCRISQHRFWTCCRNYNGA
ncbi:hypothetical protein D3C86_1412500 [compost metagenome]